VPHLLEARDVVATARITDAVEDFVRSRIREGNVYVREIC
jgi:hypothetical protein